MLAIPGRTYTPVLVPIAAGRPERTGQLRWCEACRNACAMLSVRTTLMQIVLCRCRMRCMVGWDSLLWITRIHWRRLRLGVVWWIAVCL